MTQIVIWKIILPQMHRLYLEMSECRRCTYYEFTSNNAPPERNIWKVLQY
jgi:hypothetical protein